MGGNRWVSRLGIGLAVLLMGCSSLTQAQSPNPVEPQESVNAGQILPISAIATINAHTINLEVAKTQAEQQLGLMYRTSLADDRGMLFLLAQPQTIKFWMKNTLIPLDMIFLRDGQVKAIETDVPPCTTEPCLTYGPEVEVDGVIELRGGRAAELGLQVGEQVKIKFLEK